MSAPPLQLLGRGDFDPARAEGRGAGAAWRGYATAARLGWQMEANWTKPIVFACYSVVKPVASALMLVFMLMVIGGGGPATAPYRAYVVIGSALWSFVVSGIAGLAWSVLDDRERYRMLKYLYLSPTGFLVILLGRGTARLAIGALGAVIVLLIGVVFLGVPFDPLRVDWPLLVVVMTLGLVSIVALGVLMAAVVMQTRQESWSYPEALAGALFLIVGAVFPLAVLPVPAQALGLLMPLTWWIAGVREALFPGALSSLAGEGSLFTRLTGQTAPAATTLVLALLATGLAVTLAAAAIFRRSERRAKDRGLIDRTTGS